MFRRILEGWRLACGFMVINVCGGLNPGFCGLGDTGNLRERDRENVAGVVLLANHDVAGISLEGLAVCIDEQKLLLGSSLLGGFTRSPKSLLDRFGGELVRVGHAQKLHNGTSCATIIFNNFNFPRKALFYMGFLA